MNAGGVWKEIGRLMYGINDIRVVHLEPTQLCQALCPMCDRTTMDGKVNPILTGASLSLSDIKDMFSPEFISQLRKMYMCGNVGDPMLAPDCIEILEYFRKHNDDIVLDVVTNGGARTTEFWTKLAKVTSNVVFSIDGLEDTNHIYRRGVQWKNVMRNVKAFIAAGGIAKWAYLVFEHNEHQVEEAEKLAKDLGFKEFALKSTNRYGEDNKPVRQTYDRNGRKSNVLKTPSTEKYKSEIIENRVSYKDLQKSIIVPNCVKKKEIYVTATGDVYPCCWSNTAVISSQDTHPEEILDAISQQGSYEINAKKLGIKKAMEWFVTYEERWCTDDKPMICSKKCNTIQNHFELQTLVTKDV